MTNVHNYQECPVVISLAQRLDERKNEHAIGFRVYKVNNLFDKSGVISNILKNGK